VPNLNLMWGFGGGGGGGVWFGGNTGEAECSKVIFIGCGGVGRGGGGRPFS